MYSLNGIVVNPQPQARTGGSTGRNNTVRTIEHPTATDWPTRPHPSCDGMHDGFPAPSPNVQEKGDSCDASWALSSRPSNSHASIARRADVVRTGSKKVGYWPHSPG